MLAAGIDPDKVWSPSPPGGEGEEEGESGEGEGRGGVGVEGVEVDEARRPTGMFREGSMRLVESAVTAASFGTRCVSCVCVCGECLMQRTRSRLQTVVWISRSTTAFGVIGRG